MLTPPIVTPKPSQESHPFVDSDGRLVAFADLDAADETPRDLHHGPDLGLKQVATRIVKQLIIIIVRLLQVSQFIFGSKRSTRQRGNKNRTEWFVTMTKKKLLHLRFKNTSCRAFGSSVWFFKIAQRITFSAGFAKIKFSSTMRQILTGVSRKLTDSGHSSKNFERVHQQLPHLGPQTTASWAGWTPSSRLRPGRPSSSCCRLLRIKAFVISWMIKSEAVSGRESWRRTPGWSAEPRWRMDRSGER